MSMAVVVMLITSLAQGPTNFFSFLVYFACCMPFMADFGLSLGTTYARISGSPERQGATVTELTPENEEAFIAADGPRQRERDEERKMVDPSDRLVPPAVRDIEPVYNLITSDWKENAVASDNSTGKQLVAFAMIAGYLYFGGMAVGAGAGSTTGAVTLAYGASSLLGYFGLGDAPVARLMRTNMVSVLCAILAVVTMVTGGMSMNLLALTMLHMFDAF